jgi:2-isopropylmalate synthase
MGIRLEDEDFQRSFDRFKQLADRKGEICEEGIRAIVSEETGALTHQLKLVALHVAGGSSRRRPSGWRPP